MDIFILDKKIILYNLFTYFQTLHRNDADLKKENFPVSRPKTRLRPSDYIEAFMNYSCPSFISIVQT